MESTISKLTTKSLFFSLFGNSVILVVLVGGMVSFGYCVKNLVSLVRDFADGLFVTLFLKMD